jgi:hypothetical protein
MVGRPAMAGWIKQLKDAGQDIERFAARPPSNPKIAPTPATNNSMHALKRRSACVEGGDAPKKLIAAAVTPQSRVSAKTEKKTMKNRFVSAMLPSEPEPTPQNNNE